MNSITRNNHTPTPPTIRRLADVDVRAIFECLHHHKPPPAHLNFRIVTVGTTGLKLSPPSLEFEDGLYVLLRPQHKKNNLEQPKAPAHLQYLVEPVAPIEYETCPWSLSGPQFPQPTAIQQRYCYPKGRQEYASFKGGALWTMYDADGKENLEFRLLHVYYSAKRAINRQQQQQQPSVTTASTSDSTQRMPKKPRIVRRTATAPARTSTISHDDDDEHSTPLYARTREHALVESTMDDEWLFPPTSPILHHEQDVSLPEDDFLSPLTMHSLWPSGDDDYDDDSHQDWLASTVDHLDTPSFEDRLSQTAGQLHQQIQSAPRSERAMMVAAMAHWARQLAADPFADPRPREDPWMSV